MIDGTSANTGQRSEKSMPAVVASSAAVTGVPPVTLQVGSHVMLL
jgi:hypothetical protein